MRDEKAIEIGTTGYKLCAFVQRGEDPDNHSIEAGIVIIAPDGSVCQDIACARADDELMHKIRLFVFGDSESEDETETLEIKLNTHRQPVGRIEFTSSGETVEYYDAASLVNAVKEENFCGVPMSVVLYMHSAAPNGRWCGASGRWAAASVGRVNRMIGA